MSRAAWQDFLLQDLFRGYGSREQVDDDEFLRRLGDATGSKPDEKFVTKFAQLDAAKKKQFITNLWQLTHPSDNVQETRQLYKDLSLYYDKYFEWEDPEQYPDWILPGPL